jgi:hypothetical protein
MDLRFNNASVIRLRISLSTINSTQTNSPKRFLHKTHDFNGIKISIKFYSSITIRKSFINSRNKIEELVQVEEVTEKRKKKKKGDRALSISKQIVQKAQVKKRITTAEAEIGGESPISRTVTSALPNAFGDSIKCKHRKSGGSGTISTTRGSFTKNSKKQLPPIIDRFN